VNIGCRREVKAFDFNVDGLAHVGLLPDLVADCPLDANPRRADLDQAGLDDVCDPVDAAAGIWRRGPRHG